MVYLSFLLIIISVFIFSFFFQFLDSPSQKITMHDFYQEVTFKQYFYLHQQFMLLCANCLSMYLFFLFVFFFFFFGGGGGGGGVVCVFRLLQLLKKDLDLILDTKKIMNFQRSPFNVFLMTLAFYLIFL